VSVAPLDGMSTAYECIIDDSALRALHSAVMCDNSAPAQICEWPLAPSRGSQTASSLLIGLPLNVLRHITDIYLGPSLVIALSSTCSALHCCTGLSLDFCRCDPYDMEFFVYPWQLVDFVHRTRDLFSITGASLLSCDDEELQEVLSVAPRLRCLQISSTLVTTLAPLEEHHSHMKVLVLQNASQLIELGSFSEFSNLATLQMTWAWSFRALPKLTRYSVLEEIDLYQCREVRDINNLLNCTKLRKLNITCLPHLTDISVLGKLDKLVHLQMNWCEQLDDITPLADRPELTHLSLCHCSCLEDIHSLGSLPKLEVLNLSQCRQLTNIEPLMHCGMLRDLKLFGCKNLCDLSPLSR